MPIELYENQRKALTEMHNGCILCGEVGNGKSITGLAYFHCVECGGRIKPTFEPMTKPKDLYIITTAMKRDSHEWDKEITPFLLGTDIYPNNKVVVDSWNNIGKYVEVADAFFIFDEDRVVGAGAWVKAFLKITKTNHWILLSATPGDRWVDYIPVFIANGFYKNRTEFNREHVIFSRYSKFPKVDRYVNTGRLIRLRSRVLVNMEDLREAEEHHKYIDCGYDIYSYRAVVKDRWNPYTGGPVVNAAELCYVLRKVVNTNEERLRNALECVLEHSRAIIFYNFDDELNLLKKTFEDAKICVAEWNGHKHQPIPIDENRWVYLVQYNAGSEGWNCIATDTIIFYSQNYSYKMIHQACGRINRMNTPFRDLYYYHFVSKAPIDIAISRALKTKKNFNEERFVRTL